MDSSYEPEEVNIVLTDTLKERGLDENPQRHFDDKKNAMYSHLLNELIEKGCVHEKLEPTGKPGEYRFTITLKALKSCLM